MKRMLPSFIYIITILLLSVDIYGFNDRLEHYLRVDSRMLALTSIYGFIIWRIFKPDPSTGSGKNVIWKINLFLLPLALICSLVLTVWAFVSPPNYVYSLTHLNYQQLFLLALFSGVTQLLQLPNSWYKKYTDQLMFLSGITIFTIAEIVWMFPFETFRILSHEDGYIEYLQVFMLLLAAFWSAKIAKRNFFKNPPFPPLSSRRAPSSAPLSQGGDYAYAVAFGLTALMLFFVAGDEISWGQRLFELQTPQTISEQNLQGEITVHNLKSIQSGVDMGYLFLSAFGAFSWIFQKFVRFLQKEPYAYFIPPWSTSFYFFLGFVYFIWARFFPNQIIGHWNEFSELMIYTGIMWTMFRIAFRVKG